MTALGREGVGVEPVEQLRAVAGDNVELRAVHMGIDQPRRDQPAAVVVALPAAAGVSGAAAGDAAVFDQQPVIGVEAHLRRSDAAEAGVGSDVEQIAAQGELHRTHACTSRRRGRPCVANARATSRTCSRSQRIAADACVTSCQSW
jgi:hypothetical protein